MIVRIDSSDGLVVIRPRAATLDGTNARSLRLEVQKRVPPGSLAVLDLSGVVAVDSTGCGAILASFKHVRGDGSGHLGLAGASEELLALFEIIRLDTIVDLYATLDDAKHCLLHATTPGDARP